MVGATEIGVFEERRQAPRGMGAGVRSQGSGFGRGVGGRGGGDGYDCWRSDFLRNGRPLHQPDDGFQLRLKVCRMVPSLKDEQ